MIWSFSPVMCVSKNNYGCDFIYQIYVYIFPMTWWYKVFVLIIWDLMFNGLFSNSWLTGQSLMANFKISSQRCKFEMSRCVSHKRKPGSRSPRVSWSRTGWLSHDCPIRDLWLPWKRVHPESKGGCLKHLMNSSRCLREWVKSIFVLIKMESAPSFPAHQTRQYRCKWVRPLPASPLSAGFGGRKAGNKASHCLSAGLPGPSDCKASVEWGLHSWYSITHIPGALWFKSISSTELGRVNRISGQLFNKINVFLGWCFIQFPSIRSQFSFIHRLALGKVNKDCFKIASFLRMWIRWNTINQNIT